MRRDRIYAVRRFIALHQEHGKSVGTAFMPSGDSSPCIKMNSGNKRVETVHGDESLDGINAVPTEEKSISVSGFF
jgi:hypothetical protein